jgi:flotillin
LYETPLEVDCVTKQGIQVIVKGVVIFKIGDSHPLIANAARRFLGTQDQMQGQVYNVFEGHLRSIIGSLTVEEMIRDRDKLTSGVRGASGTEMEKLGLVVDSLQIKDFKDPSAYIANLAKPHIAQVQMEARIAQAARNREASEREAEAEALVADAQSISAIKQSTANANAAQAKAAADQAGPLADATARQKVVVAETEAARLEALREEQRLQGTVYKRADAEAYEQTTKANAAKAAAISNAEAEAKNVELAAAAAATAAVSNAEATRATADAEAHATKARGEAEADAVRAKGQAEGAAIQARADALATNQDAVIAQQVAENLPAIIKAAAEPWGNVGQLTVLDGAEGMNRTFASVLTQAGQYLPQIMSAFKQNGQGAPNTTVPTPDGKVLENSHGG